MTYPTTIAGCCRELLDTSGPKTLSELAEHVVAEGRSQARYPEMSVSNALTDEERVFRNGDVYVSVPVLVEGRVLTTRHPAPAEFWSRTASWLRASKPWFFDLAAFPTPSSTAELPGPAAGEGQLSAWRMLGGELVVEPVPEDGLGDPGRLIEAVRAEVPKSAGRGHGLRREVLLACLENDDLLRNPLAPLSELFPEHAPREPEPVKTRPRQRRCRACDGTGWQYGWDDPYDSDWSFGVEPSDEWRCRIERLEEAVFSFGGPSIAVGSTTVVPLGLWPES